MNENESLCIDNDYVISQQLFRILEKNTDSVWSDLMNKLNSNPLFANNQNITILKKEKKPNDIINIIYVFDKENNTIKFPNTEMLGFINSC